MICQENENPFDSLPDYVSHVSATKKVKTQIRVTNCSALQEFSTPTNHHSFFSLFSS
jgi:hypothetical protein